MENKLTILGLVFLGPAMRGAIFVVTDMAFDLLVASIVSAVMIIAFVGLWFVLPLSMAPAERVAKITTVVDHRGAKEVAIDAFHLVYTATISVAYTLSDR